MFGARWRAYLPRRFPHSFDPVTGVYRARRTTGVYRVSGPGAPFATIVIEELAALGARRFLLVGLAGSLRPELRAGDLVVCTRAVRDEGTSHHYAPWAPYSVPARDLTRRLRAALEDHGVAYLAASSWTTDAPYRETRPEIRRFRERGVATVEMEAAAAFTVARHLGREAAALFVVSDHLDDRGWEPRFHDTRPALHRALELAIATFATSPESAPGAIRGSQGRARPRRGSSARAR